MNSVSHSPIISFSPNAFYKSTVFNHLNIKNLFNSFLYQITKNQLHEKNDQHSIQNSNFANILNSAIYFSSGIEFSDELLTEQQVIETDVTINNCCFHNCQTVQPNINGGAINIDQIHFDIIYNNVVFSKCRSEGIGGAIYSKGGSFIGDSCIFSECESAETGMAIFFNRKKIEGSPWPEFKLNQTRFSNNQGKSHLLDLDVADLKCQNCNMTNNRNKEFNSFQSENQNCAVISLFCEGWMTRFHYINVIGNEGDYLISIDPKPDGNYQYVNVIGNFNLNYFFQFSGSGYDVKFSYFSFFNNYPKSTTQEFHVSNQIESCQFSYSNCIFDYSENQVKSMFEGMTLSNNTNIYGQALRNCGIDNAYTFEYAKNYVAPTKCVVPSIEMLFDANDCSIKKTSTLPSQAQTQTKTQTKTPTFTTYLPSQTKTQKPTFTTHLPSQTKTQKPTFTTHLPSQTKSFPLFTSQTPTKTPTPTLYFTIYLPSQASMYTSQTPTQSKSGQKLSFMNSFVQTYVMRKSVSISHSMTVIRTNTISFNHEIGENTKVLIEKNATFYLPYIIYYYTQTNVPTVVVFEVNVARKKITPEQLIGIVCVSSTGALCIAGIIFLFFNKTNKQTYYSDLMSDDSSEDFEITRNDIEITNTQINEDDNWL